MGIVVAYVAAGVVLQRANVTAISAPFVPNLLITLAVVLVLAIRRRWSYLFFQKVQGPNPAWLYWPLALVLIATAADSFRHTGFTVTSALNLLYQVVFAASVGFVEETVFRGVLMRAWLHKGLVFALVVANILFGLTHIPQLLNGQQDVVTVLQVLFAIVFGVAMSVYLAITRSIVFPIVFHALFDGVQLVTDSGSAHSTSSVLEPISLAMVGGTTLVLIGYIVYGVLSQEFKQACADLVS